MMFQLPPLKLNLPKPAFKEHQVHLDDGRQVKCLKRDTYLDMRQMALSNFPPSLLKCEDLEVLLLGKNYIRQIPRGIAKLDFLSKLDLSHNKLYEFPVEIVVLNSLRELDLSNNAISTIPHDIKCMKFLKRLDVSNNRLRRLPNNLSYLVTLTYLNISFNKLTEYPVQLCSCFIHLRTFKCSYNHIVELPYEIIFLPEACLEPGGVDFRCNPLTFPPIEIAVRGLGPIRNFMEPKWKDLKEFKRRKLIQNCIPKPRQNMTRTSLWDKAPSVSSKSSSVEVDKKKRAKPSSSTPRSASKHEKTSILKPNQQSLKSKSRKVVRTSVKKSSISDSRLPKGSCSGGDDVGGDLDDSSRATLVEVYGDNDSPVNQLSPLPDHRTPAGQTTPQAGSEDETDVNSELAFLMGGSIEPPDVDVPEAFNNMGGGGGILEQWLGTVQSITLSPTTRGEVSSCELDETSRPEVNPYTPFSDVRITKKGDSEEEDEEEETEIDNLNTDLSDGGSMKNVLEMHDDDAFSMSRHSISTPDAEKLSVIFSDDAEDVTEQQSYSEDKKKDDSTVKLKGKKGRLRRGSHASYISQLSDSGQIKGKKKRKKKRKKKLKKELSELELYSRIPFKPLFIAPRVLPTSSGLKTWTYFTEPKSCYLIDNLTEISSSSKRVSFGSGDTMAASSAVSVLTESVLDGNSDYSELNRSVSVHSIDSNQSQLLSLSGFSSFSQQTSQFNGSSSPGCSSQVLSEDLSKRRPSSLPAPKHHTWTNEELRKFVYRPSDLIIPPTVLVSYYKHENSSIHLSQIERLVNTLHFNGLAECICDLTIEADQDFSETGYRSWLDEQAPLCEYIIVVISRPYLTDLSILTKTNSKRPSPYVTPADIKRWELSTAEVTRRFIPVLLDDMDQTPLPGWLQSTLPFFVPSELCELGYHLVSRDSRDSCIIPRMFEEERAEGEGEGEGEGSVKETQEREEADPDTPLYQISPVTAHLVVPPNQVPPDWRLLEIAGKIRFSWREFAQTCGFDPQVIADIDSVYSGSINKSAQCLRRWKVELVGSATYEELARRLNQIAHLHVADAYCNFGNNCF